MKLCTFEIRTTLGRHWRLGAVIPQGIADLNSACVWHLSRNGETRPYALAEVLLPDNMLEFIQGGATTMGFATATLESLDQELRAGSIPAGLNGETLIYKAEQVT